MERCESSRLDTKKGALEYQKQQLFRGTTATIRRSEVSGRDCSGTEGVYDGLV